MHFCECRYYSYYSVINILISYKNVWIGQSGLESVREVTQSLASPPSVLRDLRL